GAADVAAFVNQWWKLEQKAALAMQEDAEAEVLRQAALENLAQELAAAAASAPEKPVTATLSGTFVEETTGLPITNGTLHAMSGTGIILGEWKTDETGAFAYTVVTPGMVATLKSDEYELLGDGAGPYVFEGEQNIAVTGRLRGVVSGQVVEAGTTNGVVNLPVRLVPEAEGAWERKANTDENGRFEMRGLDDGAYTLTTAAGFAWQPAAGQRIELSATNRAATMVLEVAPGLSWMGTLLQEGTSNGVAGVHLRLCDTNKATLAEATTDEDGDFVFAGLAAGDYVVCADGARWAIVPEDANVRLEGDDPLHEGDLHAGRGRLFRAMPEIGVAPLEVAFTVLLTEETKDALAFAWDLDGDGVVDSTDVLPTWTYGEAGTNDVALMVTLADGSVVTNVQPACVTVRPAIPTLYRDGVVVLTEGAPENTGDYQIASWTNGTLTLTRLTAEPEHGIEAGTKVFFDPGGDLPYALLRVTAIVSETGAETVLSTETVPFGEIFRSFSMKLASSPEPGPGPSGRRGGRHAKTI
ncbi:MAG: hypothetical protein J6Y19_02300, partial [Kiritimatiellae bacterium]|nr:hypothetical protein [Kiritimatiellia bacterium]